MLSGKIGIGYERKDCDMGLLGLNRVRLESFVDE